MFKARNIFIVSLFLGFTSSLYSCTDDVLLEEGDVNRAPELLDDQFALGFTVTLDAMGEDNAFNPMKEWENYIDPQKFRVLFFDDQERFLFESKSRWVKRESNSQNSTAWYVSVPFYNYGNDLDEGYDWDFDAIRNALLDRDFKIALLVNRPLHEYASDYATAGNGIDGVGRSGWFDNSGPHWKKHNSYYGYTEADSVRRIFDLHHCSADPVYLNKSKPQSNYNGEGFYDFIMDGDLEETKQAKFILSPFKSWVVWEGEETDKKNQVPLYGTATGMRKTLHPSAQHPIPMYGVQNFKSIDPDDWKPGTTIDLSRNKQRVKDGKTENIIDLPISLLRSCVKLELVVPRAVEWAVLNYSNICSRCEPMDVWTPTNEIWGAAHSQYGTNCEMDAISAYGPLSTSSDPELNETDPTEYRKKLSWFYGAWKEKPLKAGEKRWDFGLTEDEFGENEGYQYPKIYNCMIQRNSNVCVYKAGEVDENLQLYSNNGKYHLIAYTGERNLNDPNNLNNIRGSGSVGNNLLVFWMVKFTGDDEIRVIPITDYENTSNSARNLATITKDESKTLNELFQKAPAKNNKISINDYAKNVWNKQVDSYPLPLIRNHVYRLYMSGTRSGDDMVITSEHTYSKSICFPEHLKRKEGASSFKKDAPKSATLNTATIK